MDPTLISLPEDVIFSRILSCHLYIDCSKIINCSSHASLVVFYILSLFHGIYHTSTLWLTPFWAMSIRYSNTDPTSRGLHPIWERLNINSWSVTDKISEHNGNKIEIVLDIHEDEGELWQRWPGKTFYILNTRDETWVHTSPLNSLIRYQIAFLRALCLSDLEGIILPQWPHFSEESTKGC